MKVLGGNLTGVEVNAVMSCGERVYEDKDEEDFR